ncbi:MAG TPA: thioredoxin-dependent thiol peroxidase [Flavobacteriaceae bacterium]|nr:thioredoxin-dependent thiol peroxidase [Flavobacteriaceae bacterium]
MTSLKKGDPAPDFSIQDQDGNLVSTKDFEGKKWVLFFYPKASTPGCTNEVCNLRDNYQELQEAGYALLGVSADSQKRQKNFQMKNNLPFHLLADVDKKVINAYGVWGPKKFMGKSFDGIHRTTFVIDENGIIDRIIDNVKTKDHAAQILEG